MTTEESGEGKQQVCVRLERAVITRWVLGMWMARAVFREERRTQTLEAAPRWSRRSDNKPQDRFSGAAVFKGNHIANFVTDINIHFVGDPQGQLHRRLLVDLCAYHAPVLVVDGKAVFSAPLRNL